MQPTLNHPKTDSVREKHAVMLAYLILIVGITYLSLSLPLFIIYHRHWWLIVPHIFDAIMVVVLWIYLTKTRRADVVMWGMCAIDVIAIVPYALDGGVGGIGIQTVTGALLVVFLLKGRAALKFWLVTAFPAIALFLPLHLLGIIPLPYPTAEYVGFLINEALAIMLLWLYGGEKERLDHDLAVRTRELEISKASVERKVKERTHELAESEGKLNSTIQSLTTIGLLMVDRQYQTLIKNVAIDKVLAYGKDWTITDFAKELQGADLVKDCEEIYEHGKAIGEFEVSFGIRILRLGLNPVHAESGVIGIVLSVQDITEQKVLERSKEEFFSIASHELRTPLTAIRGNMSMVKNYFPKAMKDQALASMVDDAHAASIRLIEIVNDFLDSSSLEQGKMKFNLEPVIVRPILEAVSADLKPVLLAHKNTIHLEGLDNLPPILVDEGRFRQIVYNLLSNATKYTQNGIVAIRGNLDRANRFVELHFSDTGKGISLENQKLLFHKFQQAGENNLTRDDTKGTGLGLYVSRLLADNMRGDVQLESTETNKGTTFLLKLPLAKKSGKTAK